MYCSLEWLVVVLGRRKDLIKLQRGEQQGWGNSLSKDMDLGFPGAPWYKDDTILAEYQVCVGNPWRVGHQKKWEASIAILLKPGRKHGPPRAGL